jgi:alpha-N-arabinofuranosidase
MVSLLIVQSRYTLSDALAVSVWLNVFIRQSRYVGMANIAQSVNVISPLMTTKEGLLKQTTWWPLLLYSRFMRGSTIASHVRGGEYEGKTNPEWIRGAIETPWLDVSAALGDDGFVNLAVVNISEEKDFETEIRGLATGKEVEVHTVSGSDIKVTNTEEKQEVGIEETKWDGNGSFTFPKHSLTILRWKP